MPQPLMVLLSSPVCMLSCVPAIAGNVLIYSDRSPGSIALCELERQSAVAADHTVTVADAPNQFVSQPQNGTWAYVVAVHRHASSEPGWAAPLRKWVGAGGRATLWTWHDDGANVPDRVAVVGTTALTTWTGSRTIQGYALTRSSVETRVLAGLKLPTFEGVERQAPTTIAEISAQQAATMTIGQIIEALIVITTQSDCKSLCWLAWKVKYKACKDEFDARVEMCDALYRANSELVEQYTNCIDTAMTDRKNGNAAALNTYKLRVQLCPTE